MSLRIVAVSGSLRSSSTSTALLRAIADGIAEGRDATVEIVELGPLSVDLGTAVVGGAVSDALSAALGAVGDAGLLVVATPVYRGSYTGLFKQFFDLVPQKALEATPVLLAAGGGDDQHSLVIDHQLRPLFAFFQAHTLPVGVYARSADFVDGAIASDELRARVARAVEASVPLLFVTAS
jgi:FMN reductase